MDESGRARVKTKLEWFGPYSVIGLFALLLMLPAILTGKLIHDSFWIDLVWTDQFTALLREGTLYPRWLPQSYDGLGAPVFYFYPPLAFYLTGFLGLAGLSTYASVIAAFGALLAASGAGMFRWLRGWTAHPLLASILYMALPYHLMDFYRRGALAEFAGFALLPFVAIGLWRAREGRGPVWLALAYGALIMTHLPGAVLTGVLFIGPYAGIAAIQDKRLPWSMVTGILLGIGLTSVYLIPMLVLKHHVAIVYMLSQPQYQAANWSLLTPARWPSRSGAYLLAILCGPIILGCAVLLWGRRDPWAVGSIAICMIVAGLIPGFWSLPLIANLQFPWRALMLAEFLLVTALARTPLRPFLAVAAVVPMLALSVAFLKPVHLYDANQPHDWFEKHLEVREYVPIGFPDDHHWYADAAMTLSRHHRGMIEEGGRAIAPHFYFPSWQVRCNGHRVQTVPDPVTRLLSWKGKSANCSMRIELTRSEYWGIGLSLLFLALLCGMAWRDRLKISPSTAS